MTVKSEQLYNAYKTWCSNNGESYVSHKQFGQVLRERGHEAKKTGKGTFWQRIGLKAEYQDLPEKKGCLFDDMILN